MPGNKTHVSLLSVQCPFNTPCYHPFGNQSSKSRPKFELGVCTRKTRVSLVPEWIPTLKSLMKNAWEKLANKANRILYTQWTLYFSITSAPQTVPFQTVLPHECKNNCAFILFPKKRLSQKEGNNLVSFCQNFGIVGLCRNAPTVESSHTPEWRVTSRGMFHPLPKYLSWQQQKLFRDLSPGTIASVSQPQFSRLCISALTSASYQRAYHTCTGTWENHANEFT